MTIQSLSISRAGTTHGSGTRPAILGIWRVGDVMHCSRSAEVSLAQPADTGGSPRWDYVIKRAIDTERCLEHRRQILRFTAAATSASHPNLVPLLDGTSSGVSPYVVMPRLEGKTMHWHLHQGDAKPLPVALWLVRQMVQALDALHTAGWVHCDIKPENAIIGSRGHVTLIDLSFATRIHTLSQSHFRGTPTYAAPERLSGELAAMPSLDMFSIGRVLWHWLTVCQRAPERMLEPVASLVEQLVATNPHARPTAAAVTAQLLRLEIETLGRHFQPALTARGNPRAA